MDTRITAAGIGELLWDVVGNNEQLGGAPINFAYHINALGGCGMPITSVGDDERGRRALAELSGRGLNIGTISTVTGYATGYVEVKTDENGIASYAFPPDLAWDHLRLNRQVNEMAAQLDAICFGTLGQRSLESRSIISAFIDSLPGQVVRICDLNLRQHFYSQEIIERSLARANILKLSDEELQIIAPMLSLAGHAGVMLRELMGRYSFLDLVILTRGAQGCLLLDASGVSEDLPGIPTAVVDTIGAGDSFTASVVLGRLLGNPLRDIAQHANRLAAYVCSCHGAMPPIPEEFRMVT
jgi:fructokinase